MCFFFPIALTFFLEGIPMYKGDSITRFRKNPQPNLISSASLIYHVTTIVTGIDMEHSWSNLGEYQLKNSLEQIFHFSHITYKYEKSFQELSWVTEGNHPWNDADTFGKPDNLMERNQICGIQQQTRKQASCETKSDFQKFYLSESIKWFWCHNQFKCDLVLLASGNTLTRGYHWWNPLQSLEQDMPDTRESKGDLWNSWVQQRSAFHILFSPFY